MDVQAFRPAVVLFEGGHGACRCGARVAAGQVGLVAELVLRGRDLLPRLAALWARVRFDLEEGQCPVPVLVQPQRLARLRQRPAQEDGPRNAPRAGRLYFSAVDERIAEAASEKGTCVGSALTS